MSRMRIAMVALVALMAPGVGSASAGEARTFAIDPARSTLEIHVDKGGFLKAMGHEHRIAAREISGRIRLDPERLENSSLTLRVAATSLTVLDPEVSEKDRAEVQSTMRGEKVLDVARFPEIGFISTGVTSRGGSGDSRSLTLAGKLRLHGVEKQLTFPVTLRTEGAELEAQGDAELLQTDYGITPVKVAGGLVKVEDRLRIHFVIRARATP